MLATLRTKYIILAFTVLAGDRAEKMLLGLIAIDI
jgi:hypothetical protein